MDVNLYSEISRCLPEMTEPWLALGPGASQVNAFHGRPYLSPFSVYPSYDLIDGQSQHAIVIHSQIFLYYSLFYLITSLSYLIIALRLIDVGQR